ncbi:MAG: hypothetical protein CFE44_04220 [Burkholderiales bacterium PBB4]|nr:MAG: hypothetical protein CFE44_04220 [Burkholderiales bacterium PBB4]
MKLLGRLLGWSVALAPVWALAAPAPAWQACPLSHAVYRDAGSEGFTLEFSKSGESPDLASTLARVTVRHAQKGLISQWELSHSLGYGTFDLFDPSGEDKTSHGVVAFDAKLRPLDAPHGAWLFVAGLGVSNWYSGRTGARDAPVIKDPMWAFERCKP